MSYEQFIKMIREAGSMMTGEQISKIGEEAMVKFGVDKDTLMLLLLSGKQEFKDWIFDEASKIFNNKRAV